MGPLGALLDRRRRNFATRPHLRRDLLIVDLILLVVGQFFGFWGGLAAGALGIAINHLFVPALLPPITANAEARLSMTAAGTATTGVPPDKKRRGRG